MLSVTCFTDMLSECCYAEWYIFCHAECHYAECHNLYCYAERRNAESRGAF